MPLKVLKFLQRFITNLYVHALRVSYSQRLQRVAQSTTVLRQHEEFRKVLAEQANNAVIAAGNQLSLVQAELKGIGRQ